MKTTLREKFVLAIITAITWGAVMAIFLVAFWIDNRALELRIAEATEELEVTVAKYEELYGGYVDPVVYEDSRGRTVMVLADTAERTWLHTYLSSVVDATCEPIDGSGELGPLSLDQALDVDTIDPFILEDMAGRILGYADDLDVEIFIDLLSAKMKEEGLMLGEMCRGNTLTHLSFVKDHRLLLSTWDPRAESVDFHDHQLIDVANGGRYTIFVDALWAQTVITVESTEGNLHTWQYFRLDSATETTELLEYCWELPEGDDLIEMTCERIYDPEA